MSKQGTTVSGLGRWLERHGVRRSAARLHGGVWDVSLERLRLTSEGVRSSWYSGEGKTLDAAFDVAKRRIEGDEAAERYNAGVTGATR